MALSEEQVHRYARHILLPQVGGLGQERLLASSVLVVGAGGLGSPLVLYLAAAGVGRIGVVDNDVVELSNLQRQVIHRTEDLDRPKVDSAARAVRALNPDVTVEPIPTRLSAINAPEILARYDLVADGSDNFATRFLINDACHLLGKTLVSAAVLRFDGQMSTHRGHLGTGDPCYRCLHPAPPPTGAAPPSCAEAGVLGAVAGTLGCLQATEVIKELLGIGESMAGRLLIWDALAATPRVVRLPRDPGCPLCGDSPTIRDLTSHADHRQD